MWKKCKIVMLPTNEKAKMGDLALSKTGVLNIVKNTDWLNLYQPIKQELYFLSNEKIKEGDWYYNTVRKEVMLCESKIEEESNKLFPQYAKKVIATTNNSLNLPFIPQSFIIKYIEEYNKGNKIQWVMVDYEEYTETTYKYGIDSSMYICTPKVDENNYITITKVKDSWNREEVIKLIKEYHASFATYPTMNLGLRDKWIEDNL